MGIFRSNSSPLSTHHQHSMHPCSSLAPRLAVTQLCKTVDDELRKTQTATPWSQSPSASQSSPMVPSTIRGVSQPLARRTWPTLAPSRPRAEQPKCWCQPWLPPDSSCSELNPVDLKFKSLLGRLYPPFNHHICTLLAFNKSKMLRLLAA